jgi:hypothetical protein
MSQACQEAGWQRVTDRTPEGHHFMIVRNPVDRWFSGVNEYVVNNRLDRDDVIRQAYAGRMVFDQHTVPQMGYLPNVECEIIPLETATERVAQFGLVLSRMRHREYGIEPNLVPFIEDYYAEDMELYDAAINNSGG